MKKYLIIACLLIMPVGMYSAWNAWEDFMCQRGFTSIQTNWSYLEGCQVEVKPGVWIPRANFRGME
jgi:hypothetical protein